jgi:3-keto-5-aminohexanoate cleavage enzyme
MNPEDPVVVTCALSGALANREQCPGIPYTPEEYAAEARRAVDQGAVMAHIHARSPDGKPSFEIADYGAITEAIRAEVGDRLIINYSTGAIGVSLQKRIEYLEALRPDVAALNMGSMNYAKYSSRRREMVFDTVFLNPFSEILELLATMQSLGIKPEHECFDLGHIGALHLILEMEAVQAPLHVSCVMGVTGGARPRATNLAAMVAELPSGSHWETVGVSRPQWRLLASALGLGGSIRVGFEDNFYLPDGSMARSNGDLVAAAAALVKGAGRRLATVEEARASLALDGSLQAG